MKTKFKLIALDADDTLWHNIPLFNTTEARFREILTASQDTDTIEQRLYQTEKRNLEHFGYGVKSFTLSMIETAIELTEGHIPATHIQEIIDLGREMLKAPVELLDGAEETIRILAEQVPLMLLTKGDLLSQESKLARSGLGGYFSAIEIVSKKDTDTYRKILRRNDLQPSQFLMVGNSIQSDVLPVLEAGAAAVHIPYHTTWVHEQADMEALQGKDFTCLESLRELPAWLTQTEWIR
ncbi:HAD family hydrolase [Acaryochloris marina]|uniref:HAD superfamily hydrolase n=1 Tax=Acaryochloris marina (strain MBIC 11017) TaxID=329726 RepID=B0C3U9_ACAM1|nr:HAD family hydrolase [Acaryochloris marina]ABW31036.1 HAD superfamily hydrolase [Acaryochloris marina MBIC11017]BDM79756.1 haloacid dehalogenase [Acaryochloris marina MBIC10699]